MLCPDVRVREEVLLHAGPRLVLRTEGHLRVQELQVRDLRRGEVLRSRARLLQTRLL
jgi:hypothetical protein